MVVWEGHLQRARPQGMEEAIQAKVQEDGGAKAGESLVSSRSWRRWVGEERGGGQGAVAVLHGADLGHPGEHT